MGRLFDTVAALLGFTRPMTFEGQAAIWLEHLAARAPATSTPARSRSHGGELDFRPLLDGRDRAIAWRGAPPAEIARACARAARAPACTTR